MYVGYVINKLKYNYMTVMLARPFWSEVTSRNFIHITNTYWRRGVQIDGRGDKAIDGIVVGVVAIRVLQVHGHALAELSLIHI